MACDPFIQRNIIVINRIDGPTTQYQIMIIKDGLLAGCDGFDALGITHRDMLIIDFSNGHIIVILTISEFRLAMDGVTIGDIDELIGIWYITLGWNQPLIIFTIGDI